MDNPSTIEILAHFFNGTILKINEEGDIEKIVLNTCTGFNPEVGSNIDDLFSFEDKGRVIRLLQMGINGSKRFVRLASKYKVKDYADVETYFNGLDIFFAIKFFNSDRDRELENDKRLDRFIDMAQRDPLTKLLNRFGYWERVKELLRSKEAEEKVGILVVDVDNLKKINDEKGHKVGDIALSAISEYIAESVRRHDIPVRYGGDEFVIVVEEISNHKSTSLGLANRLVEDISSKPEKFLTTVSVGVHIVEIKEFERYIEDDVRLKKCWDNAVEIADEMAYKAKEEGRNRVVFSGGIS